MEQIKIIKASIEDLKILQAVGRETFSETFAGSNTAEDMRKYLEENFSEQKMKTELADPNSMFFIAWENQNSLGYLKVNTGKAQTELQDDTALEIERIYVKSSHHGKMVGQLLYNKALEMAQLHGKSYLWLGVWEGNPRAIRFYEKNGFVAFDQHIFMMGNDEQTDIMMKKELTPQENFSLQPVLENEKIILLPLKEEDFESLYALASDPKVWEQHPNKDRWKKEVFQNFFEGAMQSGGAFKIVDKTSNEVMGSTRFYDYDGVESKIFIGYTFYGRTYWGTGINPAVKKMMLDYAFQFVSKVQFHIGATNTRSQIAIGRIGAVKIAEEEVTYFGETPKFNFVYEISQ